MLRVAAAVIRQEGLYLVARRKVDAVLGGLWEFPGGKCRDGESLEDCLRREIKEELGVKVKINERVGEILYPYPHGTVILYFYRCRIVSGRPQPLGCQELQWVRPQELEDFSFPPANLPLIHYLLTKRPRPEA